MTMIAKTLFFAKTSCSYKLRILREDQSLRDHARCPCPAIRLRGDMPGEPGVDPGFLRAGTRPARRRRAALRHITAGPGRTTGITRASLVLTRFEHKHIG